MQLDNSRRGFWAALAAFFAGLFATSNASAATKVRLDQVRAPVAGPGLMGYGPDTTGTPVTVGSGLQLSGGVLSAPGVAPSERSFAVVLTRDASGNYPLPAGVRVRTEVFRNGLMQNPAKDYSIVANVVTPVSTVGAWDASDDVWVNGE